MRHRGFLAIWALDTRFGRTRNRTRREADQPLSGCLWHSRSTNTGRDGQRIVLPRLWHLLQLKPMPTQIELGSTAFLNDHLQRNRPLKLGIFLSRKHSELFAGLVVEDHLCRLIRGV